MDNKIMKWLDTRNKNKVGIYPHHEALEVCAEFGINLSEARELVLTYIKKEMEISHGHNK